LRKSLILSILFSIPSTAIAHKKRGWHRHDNKPKTHKRVTVKTPGVTVRVGGPWSVHYVPAHRAGYTWVAGHYAGARWIPGHWRPAGPAPRTHVVYVVGHWEGESYVDGYWRDEQNVGHDWNDGHYEEDGTWVEGGWVLTAEDGTEVIIMDDTGAVDGLEAEPVEEVDVIIVGDPETVESD
jgi:hypothetical protein